LNITAGCLRDGDFLHQRVGLCCVAVC
jgi:hypothetical protein